MSENLASSACARRTLCTCHTEGVTYGKTPGSVRWVFASMIRLRLIAKGARSSEKAFLGIECTCDETHHKPHLGFTHFLSIQSRG